MLAKKRLKGFVWKKEFEQIEFSLDRWQEFLDFFGLKNGDMVRMEMPASGSVYRRIEDAPIKRSEIDVSFSMELNLQNAHVTYFWPSSNGDMSKRTRLVADWFFLEEHENKKTKEKVIKEIMEESAGFERIWVRPIPTYKRRLVVIGDILEWMFNKCCCVDDEDVAELVTNWRNCDHLSVSLDDILSKYDWIRTKRTQHLRCCDAGLELPFDIDKCTCPPKVVVDECMNDYTVNMLVDTLLAIYEKAGKEDCDEDCYL